MEKRIVSHSESETRKVAQELMKEYAQKNSEKPLIVLFKGDLGAGKTHFVKEMGRELGVEEIVSPAFVVYYEYPIEKDGYNYLYHFDLYRITEPEEFENLGIEDVLQPGNVVAIEWSEKSGPIAELLRERGSIVEVDIKHLEGDSREITITQ